MFQGPGGGAEAGGEAAGAPRAIAYGGNHLVRPAAGGPQANRVVGVFHRAQKGFGFVRPKAALSAATG